MRKCHASGRGLYACMTARGDTLLCTNGPVRRLVGPALAPEHRRDHVAPYGGWSAGAGSGCLMMAAPDANRCAARLFCLTFGRGEGKHQMAPG